MQTCFHARLAATSPAAARALTTHAVLSEAKRDRTMISQGERQQEMSSQMWCSIRTSFSRGPSDVSTHALSRWAFCTRELRGDVPLPTDFERRLQARLPHSYCIHTWSLHGRQ